MVKNLVITATNSPYFDSLLTLISSIHEHSFNVVDEIVVFNLGLTKTEISRLDDIEKVRVVNFTAEEMNSHPHFMSPKWHVYKLTCLKNGFNMGKNVLWLDSGVCAISSIQVIFDKIEQDDIFFVIDTHLTKTYTHSDCQKIMSATDSELESNIISSGIFGYKSEGRHQRIINEAHTYSLIPGCCDGDQENHRHDQSILSILKSRYGCPSNDIDIYGYWTDFGRNLQTAKQIGAVIFVHRRDHYDIRNIVYKNNQKNIQVTTEEIKTDSPIEVNSNDIKVKLIDENLVGQDGLSRYISPNTGWIKNIDETNYDVAIYTDRMCYNIPTNPEKLNFVWLIEPPIINGDNYVKINEVSNKFNKVFSYNLSLTSKIDNFIYVPHGGTWLRSEDIGLHDKTENISFIYSDKQWNLCHRVRHNFANLLKENNSKVSHFGSGSDKPIEYKIEGLKNYRFSIVMENSIQEDYFTEKIIDCFLSGTIPIYWGTKNIEKYFDIDGIIILSGTNEWGFDMEESIKMLETLDENYYMSKISNITNNFNLAQKYIHPENLIINYINENFSK